MPYTVEELTPAQTQEALGMTCIGMVYAANPPRRDDAVALQAAHATAESYIFARWEDGSFSGWRLTGGTKDERKAFYRQKCLDLMEKFGQGGFITPDGRDLSVAEALREPLR